MCAVCSDEWLWCICRHTEAQEAAETWASLIISDSELHEHVCTSELRRICVFLLRGVSSECASCAAVCFRI